MLKGLIHMANRFVHSLHIVTLRLDRVFDIQRDAFSGDIERTLFSFESSGKRYFSVLVDGSPSLSAGQTITAVLTEPSNWQTVQGIRIHETGEICAPSQAHRWTMLLVCVVLAVLAYWNLAFTHPGVLMPVLIGVGGLAWLQARAAWVAHRIRRLLRS